MSLTVYQCITVQQLKIGTVSNSSVLQIGTSGLIKAMSHVYESRETKEQSADNQQEEETKPPMVPLPEPTLSLE
ncbi:spore germination protein GerPB [Paenibacillus sp. GCM10028914]|uniref:spore germination protein GerPB n=1 Tax=Paenibacillus sp. GCM10028914 TaxID=3273416 RepID=UPI003619C1D0